MIAKKPFITLCAFVALSVQSVCAGDSFQFYRLKVAEILGIPSGSLVLDDSYMTAIDENRVLLYLSNSFRQDIELFDLTDPSAAYSLAHYKVSELLKTYGVDSQFFYSAELEWPIMYIACLYRIVAIDVSTPDDPQLAGVIEIPDSSEWPHRRISDINLRVVNGIALISVQCQWTRSACLVMDVRNPSAPELLSIVQYPVAEDNNTIFFYARRILWDGGRYAYLAPGGWLTPMYYNHSSQPQSIRPQHITETPFLAVLDLQDRTNPQSTFLPIDELSDIFKYKDVVYARILSNDEMSRWIPIDVSEPMAPVLLEGEPLDSIELYIRGAKVMHASSEGFGESFGAVRLDNELLNRIERDAPGALASFQSSISCNINTGIDGSFLIVYEALTSSNAPEFSLYK